MVVDEHRSGGYRLEAAPGPDGQPPQALFCDNETNTSRLYGARPLTAYPKDGINDHVVSGAATVNPERRGTKAAWWYHLTVPAGGTRGDPAPTAPAGAGHGCSTGLVGLEVRRDPGRPPARGRRVLHGDRTGRHRRRADAGGPPGQRRADLEQADLPLRRGQMARRRPGLAAAPSRASYGTQRRLAPPRLLRRARDARPVGVPVVRGLGPGLPRDPVGPPRPGLRQVPAHGAAARVVPAPQRRAPGVRVELRRRQPAGARAGGHPRVRHRRQHRHGLPRADLPEAAAQLHVVGQQAGPRRQPPVRRRLPRPRQHQPGRPFEPAARPADRAGRRDGLDGLLLPGDAGARARRWPSATTSTTTWS